MPFDFRDSIFFTVFSCQLIANIEMAFNLISGILRDVNEIFALLGC
jgi:hypothetical protein